MSAEAVAVSQCKYDAACTERGECWVVWHDPKQRSELGWRTGWVCKTHLAELEASGRKLT
jgi:hypothetical protein